MPLTGQQTTYLAGEFDSQWDIPKLDMFASSLNVNLNNLAPDGKMFDRALKFVTHLNQAMPPRDRELLQELSRQGNARLKAVADDLLRPTYYSPSGDPHDAILLGKTVFVDRANLRQVMRDFTNPSAFTTRVLIVRGDQPCGKSYSWEFLRHLAVSSVGAVPQRLRLKDTRFTPKQIFEQVGFLLDLDRSGLPSMTDEPQLARIDPLINWFKGQVVKLQRPYWLVIDDLNDPTTTPAMLDAVYALAYSIEETKPANLWVALLGYNVPITDPDLHFVAQEDARFPDASFVAEHFESVAKAGPVPLTHDMARQMAELLFSKFPKLDKESMINLRDSIQTIGEKLKLGQQP